MAFDGAFLYCLLNELRIAKDSYIDKIYQPSKDELVFLLRKKGFVKRLYITVKPGAARVQFTEEKLENPATPPNFCMLLRKYLSSAKLMDIKQPGFERLAEFEFSATNEMGDVEVYRLICELIGNQSNVILVRENGRIADALRHSDVQTAKRLILPGAEYEYPENNGKFNPITQGKDIIEGLDETESLSKKLLQRVDGFSPLVCREIEFLSEKTDAKVAFDVVAENIRKGGVPAILLGEDSRPMDFSFMDIGQYGRGYTCQKCDSFSLLLDCFYAAKENAARVAGAAHDITRLVKNLYSRTQKKLSLRLIELQKCEDREKLRIYGELIKANLYRLKSGDTVARVENYYDENLAVVEIPMNPALSPSKNADRYFKEYKKTYSAEQTLTELTQKDREELIYFESVLDSISRSESLSEIREIRDELAGAGYIRRIVQRQKRQQEISKPYEFISQEGYKILVGKNNTQNDYLTTKLAEKNDLWFHVKGIPGSHVIVFCGGKEVSEKTVMYAATLAATNSKAKDSAQVPVDYTPVKFVKKPGGAKPGMVIYTTNKTVYVTPKKEEIN